MKESIVGQKSFAFAIKIVKLYKYLTNEKREFVISKQLIRSGTSIGANISESLQAVSKKDFSNKMGIALKEANESEYWIELLFATEYLDKLQYESIKNDCIEIKKLLISIVKSSKA